jgi:hypothetical protein
MVQLRADIANTGAFQRVVRERMALATRARLQGIGRDMVNRANSKMAANFDLNRPADRRRHPGSRRAKGALDFQIDGSDFPITIQYRVLGGDTVRDRIIFMNWGTSRHDITPSGAAGGNGNVLAWQDGDGWVYADAVDHPGQRAVNFLEEAMQEAFDNL